MLPHIVRFVRRLELALGHFGSYRTGHQYRPSIEGCVATPVRGTVRRSTKECFVIICARERNARMVSNSTRYGNVYGHLSRYRG